MFYLFNVIDHRVVVLISGFTSQVQEQKENNDKKDKGAPTDEGKNCCDMGLKQTLSHFLKQP